MKKIVVGDCVQSDTMHFKSSDRRSLPWVYVGDYGDKAWLERNNDFSESHHDPADETDSYKGDKLTSYVPTYTLHNVMQPLPTLHLPISGNVFDLLCSGSDISFLHKKPAGKWFWDLSGGKNPIVHISRGIGRDKPQMWAPIERISLVEGSNPRRYEFEIGKVFHSKNLKK